MECKTCNNNPLALGIKGLTPNREKVYHLIAESSRPLSAYDILHSLNKKNATAPPTVYRALEWLEKEQLIHRVESLNAYLACHRHDGQHEGIFAICSGCGEVAELNDSKIEKHLSTLAALKGFEMQSHIVEMTGLCTKCKKASHG